MPWTAPFRQAIAGLLTQASDGAWRTPPSGTNTRPTWRPSARPRAHPEIASRGSGRCDPACHPRSQLPRFSRTAIPRQLLGPFGPGPAHLSMQLSGSVLQVTELLSLSMSHSEGNLGLLPQSARRFKDTLISCGKVRLAILHSEVLCSKNTHYRAGLESGISLRFRPIDGSNCNDTVCRCSSLLTVLI